MTQFQELASAPAVAPGEPRILRGGRYALAFLGAVIVVLVGGGMAVMLSQQSNFAQPAAERPVVDGWLPAITSANEAARNAAASRVVDGWMPRLFASDEILDGWAVRYLVSDDD